MIKVGSLVKILDKEAGYGNLYESRGVVRDIKYDFDEKCLEAEVYTKDRAVGIFTIPVDNLEEYE